MRIASGLPTWVLTLLPALAWAQSPAGSEFAVNTTTGGSQHSPAVASDVDGNFLVVWESAGTVAGRWFAAGGTPTPGELLVATYTGSTAAADVASAAGGGFVVVWHDDGRDGSGSGVFGQRVDATGAPQGASFQVNSYTTGAQRAPSVSADATGRFVVVWESDGQDGSGAGIFGQRFDASGSPAGEEFLVPSVTLAAAGHQRLAAVASQADGGFVVTWLDYSAGLRIFVRRFDAGGAPLEAELRVQTGPGDAREPDVATDGAGAFVVAWQRTTSVRPFPVTRVEAQRFDAAGAPQGDSVVACPSLISRHAAAARDPAGSFMLACWQASGQDEPFGGLGGVFGRRFSAAGSGGPDFRVNTYTTGPQTYPAIAATGGENYVVVWQSLGQDGSDYGIFGQRYDDLIFRDGFESNDLTAWSAASTAGGDLTASPAAALAGTAVGLQAVVDDAAPRYVQDDSPVAEERYRARFYFDPNGFDPGETSGRLRIRLLIAFDAEGRRLVTLVLRRLAGQYSVMARVRLSDGGRADTAFVPITDGEHYLELDWRRASAAGAEDGTFALLVDGQAAAELTALDNDQGAVDSVRLGALTVKAGAAGTLYYDQFESRRQAAIGPE